MFSYYGSKSRIAKYYPRPLFDKIKEPCAGAAYYSLLYFEKDIELIDKNPMVISIWHYLQQCSVNDIATLPNLPAYTRISREMFDCDGQYNLMRFLIVQAPYGGNNIVSKWGAMRFLTNKKRVVDNLFKVKHWKIKCADFSDCVNEKATWFIDFPYTNGGDKYPFKAKYINFNDAAIWCKSREGQVIVCENTKASWLPFVPFKKINGVAHQTVEAIWSNYPDSVNYPQQRLF